MWQAFNDNLNAIEQLAIHFDALRRSVVTVLMYPVLIAYMQARRIGANPLKACNDNKHDPTENRKPHDTQTQKFQALTRLPPFMSNRALSDHLASLG